MAFLSSLNIAASGMAAERLRLDVISQNVANAKTTRTEDGTPYRRQVVLFSENKGFNSVLEETIAKRKEKIAGGVPANTVSATKNKGVLVTEIVEDETPLTVKSNMVYTLCKHMVYMLSITNEHKNELEMRAKPEWKVHFLCFASAKRGSFSIR